MKTRLYKKLFLLLLVLALLLVSLPACAASKTFTQEETDTSVAILDALKAVAIPAVEAHISDVSAREAFRQISYPGMYCEKTIAGLGLEGYRQAILYLKEKYGKKQV